MPTRAQINAAVGRRFTELAQQAVADKTPAAGGGCDGPKGWSHSRAKASSLIRQIETHKPTGGKTCMGNRVIEWMMSSDTGISSKAIVAVMTGANLEKCRDLEAPYDPADLGRCLRLLEQFPEWKLRMGEMSRAGRRWEIAVACWHEIAASMEAEVGIDWSKGRSAPITYKLMKERGL